jgi:hypothetical protein
MMVSVLQFDILMMSFKPTALTMRLLLILLTVVFHFSARSSSLVVVDGVRVQTKIPRYALLRPAPKADDGAEHCSKLLTLPRHVELAILRANDAFEVQRGWTKEFVMTRLQIARQYWGQSEYRIILDQEDNDKVVGVIAVTRARYTAQSVPRSNLTVRQYLQPLLLLRLLYD